MTNWFRALFHTPAFVPVRPPCLNERVLKLASRLDELKSRDPHFKVFGSVTHRYIGHPVPEQQLVAFEATHDFEFPRDFRDLLLHIGTGVGPEYGLFTLDRMIAEQQDWATSLGRPGTLSEEAQFQDADAASLISRKMESPSEFYYEELGSLSGVLPICFGGCTYYDYLIVNGQQRGKVWALDLQDFQSLPAGVTREVDVIEWYERWLERSFAAIDEGEARVSSS